jgi:hypothetical protein
MRSCNTYVFATAFFLLPPLYHVNEGIKTTALPCRVNFSVDYRYQKHEVDEGSLRTFLKFLEVGLGLHKDEALPRSKQTNPFLVPSIMALFLGRFQRDQNKKDKCLSSNPRQKGNSNYNCVIRVWQKTTK